MSDQQGRLDHYIDSEGYTEHNQLMKEGLQALRKVLSDKGTVRKYDKIHRILAEGSFVLSFCEGYLNEAHVSFYDLFRVSGGKIVEHWDAVDPVPPRSE